ncbi:MAG: ribosome maturation factor RimM [Turicibacter sp.]|nr:ribosome maturation factor RimM [Turicibacter sp.]
MDFLQVGKIVNTHALQGEVKVVSNSDFKEDRFKKGSTLVIDFNGERVEVVVATHRVHKGADLLKFKHLNSINDVEKYKGCALLVSTDDLEELEENEFYYFEIIGCEVVTTDGEKIGEISEILETGANDVWVVKRQGQKDALIPYIEDVVKDVDIDAKTVTIQVLEGLL